MEHSTSPRKALKSPVVEVAANINIKTSITCANVPDGLFDAATAEKHFGKFGRVQKIKLFPKKQMCIIEYDQPMSAERAVLNAGAFDGFMFDVTRMKTRMRRKSKREEDPDWLPDPDVEEELSAMSGIPTYRAPRQKSMDAESPDMNHVKNIKRTIKQSPIRSKVPTRIKKTIVSQPTSGIESPVLVPTNQTTMSTAEAAADLVALRSRVSLTPDEQWRTLDARDRILRAWGGAGSRVKIGGATIGTCPDMCPEKELLHRQAEHQVMTLETVVDSDGQLEPWRAVKQYSRSSADQEMPMCYELRPPLVLMRTCAYLLHEIADTTRQISLADWFHFMWDRLRGIRKDITQQALCCAESIRLVEMCSRFHAHCAARLADLEHTQFDQKLNTDNLTKCLQTLKHMYADVGPEIKPNEAEFRGYIALLNLGDANFWWEIKQLPVEIQKSPAITLAMKVFNALDNNNYVKFFRLVKEEATYLQACILLRYFNDVRARALARIVKAFAPRGGSKYPAEELIKALSFESMESMNAFISHYGLRFSKDQFELSVILDRNQFIEDSDPYPTARAIQLIESKRQSTVGEVIAGGKLPDYDYMNHTLYTSFNKDGKLKDSALTAEEQGYNTINDSQKGVQALKTEIQRLAQGGRIFGNTEKNPEPKANIFVKPDNRALSPGKSSSMFISPPKNVSVNKSFSFKPAIPVAPKDVIKNSPQKIFGNDTKSTFSFSKPQDTGSNIFVAEETGTVFKVTSGPILFNSKTPDNGNLLKKNTNQPYTNNLFGQPDKINVFKKPDSVKSVFGDISTGASNGELNKNVFANSASGNAFGNSNIFTKIKDAAAIKESEKPTNIFAKAINTQDNDAKTAPNVFGVFKNPPAFTNSNNLFSKPEQSESIPKSVFATNGDVSPGTLFKSANTEGKTYSIFQSKNKPSTVADNIFNSVHTPKASVYEFDQNDNQEEQLKQQRLNEEKMKEEMEKKIQEEMERKRQEELDRKLQEEKLRRELQEKEEQKRKEEQRKKQEELRILEEKRRKEEQRKQEELKRKLEEERKAELKRKAEQEERRFQERVEKESSEVTEELINEVRDGTIREMLTEETEKMKILMSYANTTSEKIVTELCDEIIYAEMIAEKIWTDKLMKKWFLIWKKQFHRNYKRRRLLDDTPVWLTDKTPVEEATHLRRSLENVALKHMNAIHRGYTFCGELRQFPVPESYNIMEIIRSSLLKRMKQINYPYDKCFFWKVTLVSPGEGKWLCKKIEIEKWLIDAFSDKKKHDTYKSLIRVEKQSWNNLMDFAISVSLTDPEQTRNCGDAVEGSNGLLFYTDENDEKFITTLKETIRQTYEYQVIPVTVIMPPRTKDTFKNLVLEPLLSGYVNQKIISDYRIFVVDPQNISESLNATTKTALKWMAKKYPMIPPLEVDYLKSICQRYLGNEIWYRLKSETDSRMLTILKDLGKLVSCYNAAVDKLTEVITNEDHFNYTLFPLEFKEYLDHSTPYPKSFEFIPINARNSENTWAIREMMNKLKLPRPVSDFQPLDVTSFQGQIRTYCNEIGWFENTEDIVCKVVAKLPTQFVDIDMPCEEFSRYFEHYDLIDVLNILVYEKINRLQNFDNRFAMYTKSALEEYRNSHWLYEINVLCKMKHKPLDHEDDLDRFIEAKRRRIAMDSMEYLMLEDKDCTMVEGTLKAVDENVSTYSNCKDAVRQLEDQIDFEKKKSMELENLLKSALSEV